jgi:hypothetical protein
MSGDESSGDSEQQSDQEPADSDQASAHSDDAPLDSDQPDEQSQKQPAEDSGQSTEQSEEESTASDQPAQQSEEQPPAETDQSEQPSEDQSASASDQPEEQSAGSDQAPAQSEEQPADRDQPSTSETADNTQRSTGGAASAGGGGGILVRGPAIATKVQVIAKFMTNNANDPFIAGSITMNVFDGAKGNLLWKLGSMDQLKVTFQVAAQTSNIIKSAMFSGVTGNNVKVELKVKMLEGEHTSNPQIPEVTFGTAAKFELPAKGPLNVDVDVEVTEKEFTVDAADEGAAGDAARKMLANMEEVELSHVKSATNVGAGRFRVVFGIPTKRILILRPAPLELIY